MSFIAGIYYRNGESPDDYVKHLADTIVEEPVCTANADNLQLFFQPEGVTFFTDERGELTIAGDICLYNTAELALQLGYSINDKSLQQTPEIILAAYSRWGHDCGKYLSGDFAFVIWDRAKQEMFCLRDQLGHHSFYYYADAELFVFSTHINFLSLFDFTQKLNDEYICRTLLKKYTAGHKQETVYKNVNRLVGGHSLNVSKNSLKIQQYWNIADSKESNISTAAEAAEVLREEIDLAVKRRLNPRFTNGIELSGGLDSSAVALFSQQQLLSKGKEILAFSNQLPNSHNKRYSGFSDESERIKIITDSLEVHDHTVMDYWIEDPIDPLEKSVEALGYPPGVGINVSQQPIYAAAQKRAVSYLYSGFGGDEMVSANIHQVYLKMLISDGKLRDAVAQVKLRGHTGIKSVAHVYKRYFQNILGLKEAKSIPLEEQMLCGHYKYVITSDNFSPGSIREWHYHKLLYPGLTERLETGYHITNAYGIRYRYPLLDVSLLEYFYGLPENVKTGHRYGRGLFRKALEGLLPDEIVQGDKARNTFVVPVLMIEMEKHFDTLRDWIMSLPYQHLFFKYIDRNKFELMSKGRNDDIRLYETMKRYIMVAIFLDHHNHKQFYAL